MQHEKPGMWERGCPHPKEGTPSATAAACVQVACDQDMWSPAQKCHGLPGQMHPSPSGSSQEAMSKAPLKSVNWQHLLVLPERRLLVAVSFPPALAPGL